MNKLFALLPLFAIIAISGCTYGDQNTATNGAPPNGAEAREIVVEGSEFSFNPSSIAVTQGETIKITFRNVGSASHNLKIDELGVATSTISPGQTTSATFTASRSGTFTFYCGVGNHRAQGMEGKMTVS